MAVNPDFKDLFSAFNASDVRFLVVGAHAVIHYTVPRYTKDLDVWVEPTPENGRRVFAALAAFGAPLDGVTADDFSTAGTVVQIGLEPNRIDILTRVAGLDFPDAWQRAETSVYGGEPIRILGLEDLAENKRLVARAQDLLDLEWLERARKNR